MMECSIYDMELNRLGVLTTWVSMIWDEAYNTTGAFQLEVQRSGNVEELLREDRYVGIDDSDILMLIKAVQVSATSVIASGYPADCIFSDRASTAVISNANAEAAMRGLVADMAPWPRVELGESAGLSDVFAAEKSDATLKEYLQVIAQATDMGFRLRHDKKNKKLLFECYKPGLNANARFSTLYGNMGDLVYSASTANLKNVAIVAGAGEGDARITVTAGDTSSTGASRREMYVDARQEKQKSGESEADYKARLIRYGEEKLVGQTRIENFTFELADTGAKLGDIVTCNVPEIGVKLQVRITGLHRTSQNNITTVEASVGEPIVIRRG